jgi:flagellar hook-associated protein 1
VAAAGLFRAVADPANMGTAVATVEYAQPAPEGPAAALDQRFASVGLASAPQTVEIGLGQQPVAVVPAGLRNAAVYFDPAGGQWPQVLTRDGRHLLGSALTADEQRDLLALPGMTRGATYSATYLNATGASAYLAGDYFLGALEQPHIVPSYDPLSGDVVGTVVAPARIDGGPIATDWPAGGVSAGALVLNGVALPAQAAPANAVELADWINTISAQTGVRAEATQSLRLPAGSVFALNAVASRLTLQASGQAQAEIVTPDGGWQSVDDLAAAINRQAADSGAWAHVSTHGDLVLTNPEGRALTIGGDLLTLRGTFGAALTLTAQDTDTEIRLGLGAGGTPDDLTRLGLRTGVHWVGAAPEDLVVVLSGPGRADVTASYQKDASFDLTTSIRAAAVTVAFSAPDRYQVLDAQTGTVLAERSHDAGDAAAVVEYRGLKLKLSRPPLAGDRFTIDGNRAGIGDNRTMVALAALGDAELLPGRLTLQNAYLQHSSSVGNVARQATIAEEALSVVYQQSVQLRENVAGVNLDEEAADLIRLQQAYQASARVMQTATTMFDTLLQIR